MCEVHGLQFGRRLVVGARMEASERIYLRATSLGTIHAASSLWRFVDAKKNTVILYTFYKGQLPLIFSFLFFSLSRIDLPGVSQKRPLHLTLTTLVGRAPCPQKTRNDCKWRMLFNFDVLPGCGPKMQSPPPTVPPSYPIISGFMPNK